MPALQAAQARNWKSMILQPLLVSRSLTAAQQPKVGSWTPLRCNEAPASPSDLKCGAYTTAMAYANKACRTPAAHTLCAAGMAKAKGETRQASAKAQAKSTPGPPQQPQRPKQPAPPAKERFAAETVQRGAEEGMGAFGNVPRSVAPSAPQSSGRSAAQQPPPPSKAPSLAPASGVRLLHACSFTLSSANAVTSTPPRSTT